MKFPALPKWGCSVTRSLEHLPPESRWGTPAVTETIPLHTQMGIPFLLLHEGVGLQGLLTHLPPLLDSRTFPSPQISLFLQIFPQGGDTCSERNTKSLLSQIARPGLCAVWPTESLECRFKKKNCFDNKTIGQQCTNLESSWEQDRAGPRGKHCCSEPGLVHRITRPVAAWRFLPRTKGTYCSV